MMTRHQAMISEKIKEPSLVEEAQPEPKTLLMVTGQVS